MQLIRKINKGIRFLLCVIDIISKYAWVLTLKDKKGVNIVNGFQKILGDLKSSEAKSRRRKPNKIWVDNGSEFFNNSLKNG